MGNLHSFYKQVYKNQKKGNIPIPKRVRTPYSKSILEEDLRELPPEALVKFTIFCAEQSFAYVPKEYRVISLKFINMAKLWLGSKKDLASEDFIKMVADFKSYHPAVWAAKNCVEIISGIDYSRMSSVACTSSWDAENVGVNAFKLAHIRKEQWKYYWVLKKPNSVKFIEGL